MRSLLEETARRSLAERIARLRPEVRPRWGRFNAPEMLAHVVQSLRVMVGEVEMPREPTPWLVRRNPIRYLLIHVLPFPRGLPTSAVLLARPAGSPTGLSGAEWPAEIAVFEQLLDRIGTMAPDGEWPEHGAFGRLSGGEWGVLQYRHLDHHFRQFGV